MYTVLHSNVFNGVNKLQKGLDAAWLKNKVIANNIANVDTPGFKASDVSFESAFKAALGQSFAVKKTRAKHISFTGSDLQAVVTKDSGSAYRMDGNNVNIDAQNAELAKNTIYYNTLATQLTSEFRKLRTAINEGG